jgi:hypothetical protein
MENGKVERGNWNWTRESHVWNQQLSGSAKKLSQRLLGVGAT